MILSSFPSRARSVRLVQYCSVKRRRFFFGFLSFPSLTPAPLSSAFLSSPPEKPNILFISGIAGAVPKSKVSSLSDSSSISPPSGDIKSINWSLISSMSSSVIFIFFSISSIGFMPSSFAQTRQSPSGSELVSAAFATNTTAGRFLHLEQSFMSYLRFVI